MDKNTFKDEDKKKVIEFLNFIAKNAEFNGLKIEQIIEFYKLLQYMQTQILPKINDHILEVRGIHEPEPQQSEVTEKNPL